MAPVASMVPRRPPGGCVTPVRGCRRSWRWVVGRGLVNSNFVSLRISVGTREAPTATRKTLRVAPLLRSEASMLRIERVSNGRVVLSLSGAIEGDDVAELDRLIRLEGNGTRVVLNLENVTSADRAAVAFLVRCAEAGAFLEDGPAYIREWIARERESASRVGTRQERDLA